MKSEKLSCSRKPLQASAKPLRFAFVDLPLGDNLRWPDHGGHRRAHRPDRLALGGGGMGVVCKAEDVRLHRNVTWTVNY